MRCPQHSAKQGYNQSHCQPLGDPDRFLSLEDVFPGTFTLGVTGFVLSHTWDPFWAGSHWRQYWTFQIFPCSWPCTSILRVVAIALIKPVRRGGAGRQTFNWFTAQQQWEERRGENHSILESEIHENPVVPGCFEIPSSEFVLRLKWIF